MKKQADVGSEGLSTVPSNMENDQVVASDDDAVLADMGYQSNMTRKFSTLSMLGLAFSILGTWGKHR